MNNLHIDLADYHHQRNYYLHEATNYRTGWAVTCGTGSMPDGFGRDLELPTRRRAVCDRARASSVLTIVFAAISATT